MNIYVFVAEKRNRLLIHEWWGSGITFGQLQKLGARPQKHVHGNESANELAT